VSIAKLAGMQGLAAYSASKFAVRGMMSSVAQEVGPLGIRVNAVCPGRKLRALKMLTSAIDTPLVSQVSPEAMKVHTEKANLKRMGQPEEIAAAIMFLAGPSGSYCSGTTLKVDGGWSKFC
jgi:NAD(P)-dependent dehydrogenase (short-subunit alcohol dehydrogenase family)